MGQIHVVVGGAFGSEAKGHVTGWLAKEMDDVAAVVRVAGPNAGHTAYDKLGRAWALRQVPVAAVTNERVELVIGAGSEIDPDVLEYEVTMLEEQGIPIVDRLMIDAQATVITEMHRMREAGQVATHAGAADDLTARLGSTAKGIGAARSDRIMRKAITWGSFIDEGGAEDSVLQNLAVEPHTNWLLNAQLRMGGRVIIEGTQGYGLGLHAGYYPYCTSSDCRAIDFLAMAGLTPHNGELVVWPVFRTYPIRVAGNSGPLWGETTWEDLANRTGGHIKPEKTTVTQKIRRVGEWDAGLASSAIEENGGEAVCRPVLTFLDYWRPGVAGVTSPDGLSDGAWMDIQGVEEDLKCGLWAAGTGPNSMVKLADKPL